MDPTSARPAASAQGPRAVLDEIYGSGQVRDAQAEVHRLHSNISREEGRGLFELIAAHPSVVTTLEVGCAYGLSALHICAALDGRPGAHHTIIDPSQTDVWDDIGVAQLKRAGVDYFTLLSEPSELALPELLRSSGPESFDLVFIDGWHTFDHVSLDLYYANQLVRPGGFIALDDCNWPSVSAALAQFATYPHIQPVADVQVRPEGWRQGLAAIARRLLPPRLARWVLPAAVYLHVYGRIRHPSLMILRKTGSDPRSYDFYAGL